MMKLKNSKKLFMIAMIVMMLMIMQVSVFASSGTVVITGNNGTTDSGSTVQIPTVNPTTSGSGTSTIPTVPSTNTVTPTPTPTPTPVQNSTYNQSNNLPKTGVDYSALFIIAVCVISGVYAYIKIRDYNQIKY